jgi:hypothetical protein
MPVLACKVHGVALYVQGGHKHPVPARHMFAQCFVGPHGVNPAGATNASLLSDSFVSLVAAQPSAAMMACRPGLPPPPGPYFAFRRLQASPAPHQGPPRAPTAVPVPSSNCSSSGGQTQVGPCDTSRILSGLLERRRRIADSSDSDDTASLPPTPHDENEFSAQRCLCTCASGVGSIL